MSIINKINSKAVWQCFYDYKLSKAHLSKQEEDDLRIFIENEEYKNTVEKIKNNIPFSYPKKTTINKMNSNKKRIVYTFCREENYVLKLITYLLYDYDGKLPNNLYSFRKDMGVKKAVSNITRNADISNMYSYKADISDYFNSVNIDILIPILEKTIDDDPELIKFFKSILYNEFVLENGKIIKEKKGIMAGTPISSFFANIYLTEMDFYFESKHAVYARYSDDIIVFADTKQQLQSYIDYINNILAKYDLKINERKVIITLPNEKWDFLGISYHNGTIDISDITISKLKGKIKRKAKALNRWKNKKGASDERAIKAFIRHFNRKFFENTANNELTWCRWFFPLINTDKGLKIIDRYMQDNIRFIATGKHTKANYNLRYETIKKYGYKSLVNSYYKNLSDQKDG